MWEFEDEGLLKIIFKDSFPESWKGSPEVASYLSELSSYGVERLNREPEILAEERSAILEQIQELVFNNYKTLIETAQCTKNIFQDFHVVEKHLDSASNEFPMLIEKCRNFSKHVQDISTSRHLNLLMLSKHPQLLEVLEVPQLMDTCVRNGYYDEALELSAYVSRLEKKLSSIPIISSIAKDVQESLNLMLTQLLQQLHNSIQLPACLRVVGYLRRMDVFTEAELRLKFLQARETWFKATLNAIPSGDAYHHITKVIEASRVHLFDIITQYRAIFTDDYPILGTLKDVSTGNENAIFLSWVLHVVEDFLQTLRKDLERGVSGRLDSLLGQCMYFGLSFSRVGLDFRSLLVPLFEKVVVTAFEVAANQAAKRFHESMQSFVFTTPPMFLVSTVLAATPSAQDRLHPPMSLLEFSPFALYCNNVLTAFNELRLCAPLTIAPKITKILQNSLESVVKTILEHQKSEEDVLTAREKEAFTTFCSVFVTDLVPYFDRCLKAIFPSSQLAQSFGISQAEFNKMGAIACLDIDSIVASLQHLLPLPSDDVTMLGMSKTPMILQETAQAPTDADDSLIESKTVVFGSESLQTLEDISETSHDSNSDDKILPSSTLNQLAEIDVNLISNDDT